LAYRRLAISERTGGRRRRARRSPFMRAMWARTAGVIRVRKRVTCVLLCDAVHCRAREPGRNNFFFSGRVAPHHGDGDQRMSDLYYSEYLSIFNRFTKIVSQILLFVNF